VGAATSTNGAYCEETFLRKLSGDLNGHQWPVSERGQ